MRENNPKNPPSLFLERRGAASSQSSKRLVISAGPQNTRQALDCSTYHADLQKIAISKNARVYETPAFKKKIILFSNVSFIFVFETKFTGQVHINSERILVS